MIAVALAIVACTSAGFLLARRDGPLATRLAGAVLAFMFWALIPFVTFFSLARLHVTSGVGIGLLLQYLSLALVGLLTWLLATRWLHLSRPSTGALLCVVTLANTGYLGLPLTSALLGSGALTAAIALDSLVSGPMFYLSGFAIGAAFGEHSERGARAMFRRFVSRNPPLVAAIAGLLAPAAVAPDLLLHAAHHAVWGLLTLGFFALGVNLAAESDEGVLGFPPPLTRPVGAAIVLRLAVAPAVLAGLAALTIRVPHAYLLQAAMPSGINSLVIGHAYGLDLRLASSALAWTTSIVLVGGLIASVA